MMILDKVSSRIPKGLKYFGIIVVGLVILWLSLRLETGLTNPFYIVTTASMVPTVHFNDIILVKGSTGGIPFDSLKVGDIIVFHAPVEYDYVIVSRIAEILTDSQEAPVILTKADANPYSIPGNDYPIRESDYIGKVVYIVPGAGLIFKVLSPPINYIILIGVSVAVVLYYRSKKRRTLHASS